MTYSTSSRAVAALIGGSGVVAALLPSAAFAQDQSLPAVSNVNGKFSFGYNASNGEEATEGFFLNGAVSLPVSTRLGAQLDIAATDGWEGAGLHLFMRNPDSYLLGVYVDRAQIDGEFQNSDSIRYGIEAEGYFGDVTVAAFIGRDEVSGGVPTQTFEAFEFDVEYYLTDFTALSFNAERAFDDTAASVGITHLYSDLALPLAVTGRLGTFEGDVTASIAITAFFGNDDKSLKEINRQNDPRVRLGNSQTRNGYFDILQSGRIGIPVCRSQNPKDCIFIALPQI